MGRQDPLPRDSLLGIQVLVIDDDPDACELLATILTYCGALVTTATSAESGLASVTRVIPDVIVCDVAMAGHDGYWFVAALRKHRAGDAVPVIALAGQDDAHRAERTLAAGFSGHIRKPIDPWELARLVGGLTRDRA